MPPTGLSSAPTRTRLARSPREAGQRLLAVGEVIESPESSLRYRVDRLIGAGGFGQVLDGHPRAIRVFDAFPPMRADGGVLYCLALEYAAQGDLRAFLHRTGAAWPETTARREIAGILQVLGKLHRGQTLHRDLIPMNVFVCGRRSLKLGDFGIVRQGRSVTVTSQFWRLAAPTPRRIGAAP